MDRASAPGPASEGPGVTDNRGGHLTLILRPHIEHRNGWRFHLDRFDAYLNGELILTSRQPWYDAARELLRRGYPGDTLLTMRHAGKDRLAMAGDRPQAEVLSRRPPSSRDCRHPDRDR